MRVSKYAIAARDLDRIGGSNAKSAQYNEKIVMLCTDQRRYSPR